MASVISQAIKKKQEAIKNKNSGLSQNVPNKNTASGSSGGSSGGNSQYSKPTLGDAWNANTDYQAIINNAVANNDYVTAAKAEQLRNQKITATGSNYNTTNMYAGYLSPDYGTIGQQQMANNASWKDVLDTYNSRASKASNTAGLEQYANDEIQQQMLNYILNNMQSESQQNAIDQYNQWMEDYAQENPKEEYNSKYDPQIDALLNEILNRDDFSYNAMNDPLYQQYADMYHREGDRAMKETLAEVAAGAGGMNTYAITAAQQANSYHNSKLNDKIPELYQLAYEMYLNDKESKVQDLGILQNMDATQYGRYRDTINDWYNDKNFAYGAFQDAVQQGNWQANFDNNNYWANKEFDNNNFWKDKEFNYDDYWNETKWDYETSEAEEEKAYNKVMQLIANGASTIDPELIKQAGITEAAVSQMIAVAAEERAKKNKQSSSGSDTKKTVEDDKKIIDDDDDDENDDGGYTGTRTAEDEGDGTVIGLGIGPVSDDLLESLAKAGAIVGDDDGNLYWADGWSRNNYEQRLKDFSGWGNFLTLPML